MITRLLLLSTMIFLAAASHCVLAETYDIAEDGSSIVVRTRDLEARFDGPDPVSYTHLTLPTN